jgi:pyruvate dehydrogenase E2 component (dihydrolipoamide acetyltransferase)
MERAMTETGGLKGAVEIIEPSAAERAIARRVSETRATVPDLELAVEVDMAAALALAREHSASTVALLVRAAALALREHPRANAAYRDGRFELYSRINAGVVIAAGEQLETATVLDADGKALSELTGEIDDLGGRVGALSPAERSGATFTVAHYPLGRAGALIAPPNAIALAAGDVRQIAAVREREIVPRESIDLTLACDHRIVYGALATGLLTRIKELLEGAAL